MMLSAACVKRMRFSWSRYTGKERDTESGLDYFGARYYASNMGRWMSPDWSDIPSAVPYANLHDPQSLNLYAYVENNPLSSVDDDGHCESKTQDVACIVQSIWNWLKPSSHVNSTLQFTTHATIVGILAYDSSGLYLHQHPTVNRAVIGVGNLAMIAATDGMSAELEAGTAASEMTAAGAEEFGMLREAAGAKGNFGMGEADAATAQRMGEAWVGPGARTASDGESLVSSDGLRVYRPPSVKPRLGGKMQANFERKLTAGGRPIANGHLDIK